MKKEGTSVSSVDKDSRIQNEGNDELIPESAQRQISEDLLSCGSEAGNLAAEDELVSQMKKSSLKEMKSSSDETLRTLAVIPCFNEEHTIGSLILRTRRFVDEILVVDDGSTDETAEIARELGATVISHPRNLGKSAGIKTGFSFMLKEGFDRVVTLDGDGQHNPSEIPQVLEKLSENVDISIGLRAGSRTEMPLYRRVGKRILDYTTSVGSNGVLTDSQSGFRAFSKKAVSSIYPRLKGNAFTTESEQLLIAADTGLTIDSSPITCKYKSVGPSSRTSTKTPTSHGFGVLAQVLYLVAEKHPLLFIGAPGFVLVIAGVFAGILTFQVYNVTGVFPISYALITGVLLMLGALGLFMGILLNTIPDIVRRTIQENKNY